MLGDIPDDIPEGMPYVFYRFAVICGDDGGDDVSALQALAKEVGVEAIINARDVGSTGCLSIATLYERVKVARQLIAWKADVEARCSFFRTPLYSARTKEMVRLLVEEGGAKVNVLTNDTNVSPLAHCYDPETTEALLDAGALVKFGRINPLCHTAWVGSTETMKVLLDRRGFLRLIKWRDDTKRTAYEMAMRRENPKHDCFIAMLDEALVLAKVWDRSLDLVRVGLAAVDARVVAMEAAKAKASAKGNKKRIKGHSSA